MQTQTIQYTDEDALAQAKVEWKQYCTLLKENTIDNAEYLKYYKTLKNSLYYLSKGKMILDLQESFKLAGLNEKGEPRLAIIRADAPRCWFEWATESGRFQPSIYSNWRDIISIPKEIWGIGRSVWNGQQWTSTSPFDKRVQTLVPKVPAKFHPGAKLSNYFILWEVDEWLPEPPRDPILLKPLTGSSNLFVVLAHWDLTELERSVLRGLV